MMCMAIKLNCILFLRSHVDSEEGYALPSILFLITIFSLVAFSIVGLQYFLRQEALVDVAKVKVEYASESGIAKVLAQIETADDISRIVSGGKRSFALQDGSEAQVKVLPWGMYLWVKSVGVFQKFKAKIGRAHV